MVVAIRYLHLLFAFAWFAAVFAAHWNTLQARRAKEWSARATLFGINRGLSAMIALPSLIGVGLVGNMFALQIGYRMKDTPLLVVANGIQLLLYVVLLALMVSPWGPVR